MFKLKDLPRICKSSQILSNEKDLNPIPKSFSKKGFKSKSKIQDLRI